MKPFRYYLRVRYQECDPQHVVFNARYGDFADLACFEFMRAALPRPQDAFDGTFELQTVRQVVEWKAPAPKPRMGRFAPVCAKSMVSANR